MLLVLKSYINNIENINYEIDDGNDIILQFHRNIGVGYFDYFSDDQSFFCFDEYFGEYYSNLNQIESNEIIKFIENKFNIRIKSLHGYIRK